MKLTPGAEAAWMIAAGEAASGGHPRIEPAHLLIGVLSLGKLGAGADAAGLGLNALLVREENERLIGAVTASDLDPTRLRRRARAQLGRGPVEGPPSGPRSCAHPIVSDTATPLSWTRQTCLRPGSVRFSVLSFITGAIAPSRSTSTSL